MGFSCISSSYSILLKCFKGGKFMKQKVNIDKYVGKDGKYVISMNKTFKQAFSTLELKHINLMLRINRINRMCFEYTKKWKKEKIKWNNTNYEFAFLQEEIIYHMRRVVDDMISIVWIQNQMESQQNVVKIEIDSIGRYLNKKDSDFKCFDECIEFLNIINSISNSYKHSVFQTVQNLISQEEPSFYVYGYKSNDTNNMEGEYLYSQTELLEGFEKMLNIYLREVYETE